MLSLCILTQNFKKNGLFGYGSSVADPLNRTRPTLFPRYTPSQQNQGEEINKTDPREVNTGILRGGQEK
jgi:hypothetical protein